MTQESPLKAYDLGRAKIQVSNCNFTGNKHNVQYNEIIWKDVHIVWKSNDHNFTMGIDIIYSTKSL